MTAAHARLLTQRLVSVLIHGFLLTAGTIALAFGIVDLFALLLFFTLVVTWLVADASWRARLRYEAETLGKGADPAAWVKRRNIALRVRTRRSQGLPKDGFDLALALGATALWLLLYAFITNAATAVA